MNVLSLFDGMSCGQIALNRAGIKYDKYFASEIDKHAIKVTQHNFPNTIQLGSVTDVKAKDLPKIDLIIGGSPCQGFSFAGKGLNFEDPRSKLFFEFVRLVRECQPKYFLLENVKMKHEHELVISQYMKVAPIEINSSLVSAQNRVRLYWTNINEKPYGLFGDMMPDIPQPKDKKIFLKDVLEADVPKKYFLSEKTLKTISNYAEDYIVTGKSPTLTTELAHGTGRDFTPRIAKEIAHCVAMRGRNPENPKSREAGLNTVQMIEERADKKTNCLTSVTKDNLLMEKSPCLHGFEHGTNGQFNRQLETGGMIRRLTPVECERLQTVPDNYTNSVSETQRYKMLGNGWTVDIITHILNFIE